MLNQFLHGPSNRPGDPFIPRLHKMRNYDFSELTSRELSEEFLREQDAVVIATDHTKVDYQWIVEHSPLVIDTRNATGGVREGRDKIVRA